MDFRRRLVRLGTFLLYGGTSRLMPYEKALLTRLEMALAAGDRAALNSQLSSLDHLKRLHEDRMVTFHFYRAEQLPRLSDLGEEVRLASYVLNTKDFESKVAVISHRGLLSSLEFAKSPRRLRDSAVEVRDGGKGHMSSPAEAADRLEHGR